MLTLPIALDPDEDDDLTFDLARRHSGLSVPQVRALASALNEGFFEVTAEDAVKIYKQDGAMWVDSVAHPFLSPGVSPIELALYTTTGMCIPRRNV
jgi:hypothetical protein